MTDIQDKHNQEFIIINDNELDKYRKGDTWHKIGKSGNAMLTPSTNHRPPTTAKQKMRMNTITDKPVVHRCQELPCYVAVRTLPCGEEWVNHSSHQPYSR